MSGVGDSNSKLILQNHFRWWDDYIGRWLQGQYPWHRYLPEPWWGWTPDSGMELKSISLNLSPGAGGARQLRDVMSRVLRATTYSEAMRMGLLAEHLPETAEWHFNNRARILLGIDNKYSSGIELKNHLSIEISPLHARNAAFLEDYLDLYYEEVVNHSLTFAADAARYVTETGNKIPVAVRCTPQRFFDFFKRKDNTDSLFLKYEKVVRFSFDDPRLKDVDFICFKGSRNKFPGDVKKQIEEIINSNKPKIII